MRFRSIVAASERSNAVLLFEENFDSFNPYAASPTWNTAYRWGPQTVINSETGYYVDTQNAGTTGPAGNYNPFSISNGVLTITAAPRAGLPNSETYATGVLTTRNKFSRTYGYYEIRAQQPAGSGFWSAFWLMRQNDVWPPELDIMEFVSKSPTSYAQTLHYGTDVGGVHPQAGPNFPSGLPNLSAGGFHTYAVDWKSDFIRWYYDNTEVFSAATPSDMNSPMYILINLAVGGDPDGWNGLPDGSTQSYKIDWVRVYDVRP